MDYLVLHRATVYQRDTDEPEACVFFEVAAGESAPAKLLRLAALAWGCEPAQVELYNLMTEGELLRQSTLPPLAGDVRWLECGWTGERALFYTPDSTLMWVRPLTLQRLQRAMERARTWHSVADARRELLARVLPGVPRLRQAIERDMRRREDRALDQFMAMSGTARQPAPPAAGPAGQPGGRR